MKVNEYSEVLGALVTSGADPIYVDEFLVNRFTT